MNAKLILIEGIPGSGKSVAAQTVARRLNEAGKPVRWWYEEEVGHPIYLFHAATTLQAINRNFFSGAHERVVAAALQRWARFADEALRSGTTAVADGTFFGYLTWTLHYLDRPADETLTYARHVQDALAPLDVWLVYLRQRDVVATMRHVLAVRGAGWAERTIRKAAGSPYGRARGLDGFEGLTRFWADYQALADRLFEDVRLPKLAVDVAVGGWADAGAAIEAFLNLPPARASQPTDPDYLGRFAGAYRAPDGSVAHVTLGDDAPADGALAVRGLRQVWPGQRLVSVGGDAFEVLSLPFTIRFEVDTMRIEGPELFGGRPPAALVRVPD